MMWVDISIIFLLVVAVGFCYRVSEKLKSLKSLTTVLTPSIDRLNKILNHTSQSISFLKQATETGKEGLETYIPNAHAISADITLLIEHADRISYRLDDLIAKAGEVEKNLRQTLLVSMKQSEKQARQNVEIQSKTPTRHNDPRDLFVQRVIARYPKDSNISQPEPLRNQG